MSITDKESREKILGSSSNVMISAGAGAGKTEIMSKAVIERLLRDDDLKESEVVMITFTNAAAAELKNRIVEKYQQAQEAAKKENRSIKIDLDAIHISTIHSFCSGLILQKVFDCDYGMAPEISEKSMDKDDPRIRSFVKDYFNRNRSENGTDYSTLYSFWDYNTDTVILKTFSPFAAIEGLQIVIPDVPALDVDETRRKIRDIAAEIRKITGDLSQKDDRLPYEENLYAITGYAEGELFFPDVNKIIQLWDNANQLDKKGRIYSIYLSLKKIAEKCQADLNGSGFNPQKAVTKKSNPLTKVHLDIIGAALREMKDILGSRVSDDMTNYFSKPFADNYNIAAASDNVDESCAKSFLTAIKNPDKIRNGKTLPDTCQISDLLLWDKVWTILKTLKDLAVPLKEYMVLKTASIIKAMYEVFDQQDRPDIDSDRLLHLAAQLVCGRNGKENCQYFSQKYKVFYIDEFQDTDYLQLKIFTALASDENGKLREGSLFIVGDPKQSIYRFRGAEVGFYDYVHKTYFEKDGFYELAVNHRSEKTLVDKINALYRKPFEDMFGYRDMEPFRICDLSGQNETDASGRQILHPGIYDLYDMNYKNIVALVSALLDREFFVCKDEKTIAKKVEYSDILIITAHSEPATEISELLKKAGFPVLVAGKILPAEKTAMKRLRALMRYIENSSRIRLAELCAAFAPVSNTDRAVSGDQSENHAEGLFHQYTIKEAEELFDMIQQCKRIYYQCGALETIYMAVKNGWLFDSKTGIPDIVSDLPMLYQFIESVSCKAIDNIKTVNTYIDEYMASKFKHQLEPARHNSCIRVMNLHQTKGLQGNIVICLKEKSKEFQPKSVFQYIDDTTGGPVAEKAICYPSLTTGRNSSVHIYGEDIEKQAQKQIKDERIRLDYVRDTRAAYIMINANTWSEVEKSGQNDKVGQPDGEYNYAEIAKTLANEKNDRTSVQLISISAKETSEITSPFFDASASPSLFEKNIARSFSAVDAEEPAASEEELLYREDDAEERAEADALTEAQETAEGNIKPEGALYGTMMHRAFELFFENKKTGKIMDEAEQNRCVVQAMLESLDQFAVSERVPAVLRVYQEKLRSNMQALIAELKRHDLYDLPAATETPFYCMVDAETEMSGADEEREYCRKRLLEIVSDKRHKKGRKLRKIYFSGQSDLTLFLGGTHPYSFIVDYKSDKKGYTREEIASKYRPQQECYLLISYLYQKVPGYENKMMSQQTLFAPNAFDENKMFRGELKNTDG